MRLWNLEKSDMITFSQLGRYGRTGNAMFEIAGTIGIAQKCGHEFGFPYWRNYDQETRFGGGEDIDIQKWFKNELPEMANNYYNTYNVAWGYHDITIPDWTDLHGHMQSERYFLHCEDLIRHYFTFKNQTPLQHNTVAIHFRGGDYGSDYHPHCTTEYYTNALKKFGTGLKLRVFSDSPELAKDIIGKQAEYIEGNHSMVDMELMSRCDYHIIANSTFSWWGAWLSGSSKVIAPRRWFGNVAKIKSDDIYCKDWVII
jgi:hypothetical protein